MLNSNLPFSSLFKLSAKLITQAFTTAVRISSTPGLKLLRQPSEQTAFIIAMTRGIKGGVKRNLLRRRIKSGLQECIKKHGPLPNGIFLCVAYPNALELEYVTLTAWLEKAIWKKTKQELV